MDLYDAIRANGSHTLMADRMREALERYSPEDAPRVLDHPGDIGDPPREGAPAQSTRGDRTRGAGNPGGRRQGGHAGSAR